MRESAQLIDFSRPATAYKEFDIGGKRVMAPQMAFTEGVLSIFLSRKTRVLSDDEQKHFLAFCTHIKKYYQSSIAPDVSFRQILDAEKKILEATWKSISADEENGIYEIADQLDRDEWA